MRSPSARLPGLLRGARAASLVLVATVAGGPRVEASGGVSGGAPFNVVKIDGVVGVTDAPDALAQLTFIVAATEIPLVVVEVRRVNGAGEGRALLNGLGPEASPRLRVVGEPEILGPLAALRRGSRVSVVGELSIGERLYRLLSIYAEPAEESAG
jgi:hypothetical protein